MHSVSSFVSRWAVVLVLVPASTTAQESKPCSEDVHAAFDFWIGAWEVRLADGTLAGHNDIQKRAGGCTLVERWRGVSGSRGRSINYFDPLDGRWHQHWVDNSGLILRLAGGPQDSGVRLQGTGRDPGRLHRITWAPLDDGRVRQHWEVSEDGGEGWTEVFDGFYSRLPTPATVDVGADRCDTEQGRKFDFWPGEWRVESRRLTPGGEWHDARAVWTAEAVLAGCGFLDHTTADFGTGPVSGIGSRFYDPTTDQWTITWSSTDALGQVGVWKGRFDGEGTGDFYRTVETPDGMIRSRIRWTNIRNGYADWSYAVSRDGGETWATAWEMEFHALRQSGG